MLAAFEYGAVRSETEFYDLTEGELSFRLRAASRRRLDDQVLLIKAAWHGAAWSSFTRQLPRWTEVYELLTGSPRQEMTVDQMANLVQFLQKALGGTLEMNPDYRPPASAGEEAPRG